jgi:hypothetical protein
MKNWKYLYASVQGRGHIEENIVCQDSCNVFKHKKYSICVVADGAGSSENSHIGAEHIIGFANLHFSNLVEENGWHKSNEIVSKEKWHKLAKKTLTAVRKDLEKVSIQGYEFNSLACTIIVVIHFKNKLLVTHIGDGRAGYCDLKDMWSPMITPYKGNYNSETVFVTSNFWEDNVAMDKYIKSSIVEEKIKAFCVLTDGCENASFECYKLDEELQTPVDSNKPFKEFFHQNVTVNIPKLVEANKDDSELNEIWRTFLTEGNSILKNERDDKTMILAVKIPAKKK